MGKKKENKLWKKVKKDFPKNPVLQEVHYARLKIREETKGMSDKEFISYIRREAEKVIKQK
jgi:hypothetical protein